MPIKKKEVSSLGTENQVLKSAHLFWALNLVVPSDLFPRENLAGLSYTNNGHYLAEEN
jgi:hypothetical protein